MHALNIGDTDVADIIMGRLHGDPAENYATLELENASILDATAAIRERILLQPLLRLLSGLESGMSPTMLPPRSLCHAGAKPRARE